MKREDIRPDEGKQIKDDTAFKGKNDEGTELRLLNPSTLDQPEGGEGKSDGSINRRKITIFKSLMMLLKSIALLTILDFLSFCHRNLDSNTKGCFEKCICPEEEEDDNSINEEIRNDSGRSSTDQVSSHFDNFKKLIILI